MFEVKNGTYKSVKINWGSITLPLKAGTPIGVSGVIQNGAAAIGIVPQTITVKPEFEAIYILVGGDVDLKECEASYGTAYDSAAIKAMDGIRFFDNGTPVGNVEAEIAALEAKVAAKKLCGIYNFFPSENATIASGASSNIALDVVKDKNMDAVDVSVVTSNVQFMLSGIVGIPAGTALTNVCAPYIDDEGNYSDAFITLTNTSEDSVSVNKDMINISCVCSEELPVSDD